ncbi:uncharacterized protein C8Q71DRAFT_854699 [Rhodofomes roseus]|uniref:C2H2-type domain-containing protein n=1 Tax=Rhodofomes roseus TaxID=34475 RepID=A0ABQ8KQM7_9APHY|nr:uncharacterized protein C8Q71DRAFT_854699 [Rhodofomes roseus]KAH9840840.1 hypothetical protein C8Q71DRAFT_854699 [Rhodofomes roseus]
MDPSRGGPMHGLEEGHIPYGAYQFAPQLSRSTHDTFGAGMGYAAPYTQGGTQTTPPQAANAPIFELEVFRADMYAGTGYEHTPIAEHIIRLLELYVQLKDGGRLDTIPASAALHFIPPEPAVRLLFERPRIDPDCQSSQQTGITPDAAAGSSQEGVHVCKWRGCGQHIGSTASDVKIHLISCHFDDIPEPPEVWKDSGLKLACRWSECDSELFIRSLPKHICGTHLKSNTQLCPVEGCNERLSRGDALKRHMDSRHKNQ